MNNKKLYTKIIVALLFSIVIALQFCLGTAPVVYSAVSITNADFNNYPTSTSLDSSPSGWTKINPNNATVGIINVSSTSLDAYKLSSSENPGKYNSDLDNKILMLNAKNTTDVLPKMAAFKSSKISLDAYSSYKITVLAKTQDGAKGSIYLSSYNSSASYNSENLLSFVSFEQNSWKEYNFYITTGLETKDIQLELFLGSKLEPSNNAVFFDNIEVSQIRANAVPENENITTKITSYNRFETSVTNANFEDGTLNGWTRIEDSQSSVLERVMRVTDKNTMESYGLEYLNGNNNLVDNNALVLSSNNKTYVGYESQNIVIPQHAIYKISVQYKLSSDFDGSAVIALKENDDVNKFYTDRDIEIEESKKYAPVTKTIKVSANSTNEYTNDYSKASFYVQGHPLYATSVNLQLWLGYKSDSETIESKGTVAYDDVTIEQMSYEEYNSITASTNEQKYSLTTITATPSIENGLFNIAENEDKTLSYPIAPAKWTHSCENEDNCEYGIINTYETHYNANKSNYGNFANPKSINNTSDDTDNVLMMFNKSNTYQSVTSPSFSVEKESKFYELSFFYKTVAITSNNNLLSINVLDINNNIVYQDNNLSSNEWNCYKIMIRTDKTTETLKIKFSNGSEDNKVQGFVYLDNVKLNEQASTFTLSDYDNYLQLNHSIDFTNAGFNLKSDEKDANNLYTPLSYTKKTTGEANSAFGGIIDGDSNEYGLTNSINNTNTLKNLMYLETISQGNISFTSKQSIQLEENTYYVFTIYIKTILPTGVEIEDEQYYGAEFYLSGLDEKLQGLISNNEYTKYDIYVKATTSTSVQPIFALNALNTATKGVALFDNFTYSTVTEVEFTEMQSQETNEPTGNKVFVGDTDAEEEETEEETPDTSGNFDWLLIPSLIMSLAIVIAVVGFAVRKIKFKKWQKKKLSEYDRNKTLYRDVVRKEAEVKRNEEAKQLKQKIEELNNEIKELEELNKERLQKDRKSRKSNIDKKTEKEYKLYASKHSSLLNKLDKLNVQLDDINSDDYLLIVQKKIMLENLRNKKMLEKQNKVEETNEEETNK